MTFKESPYILLFFFLIITLKACTEQGAVIGSENTEDNATPTMGKESQSTSASTSANSYTIKLGTELDETVNPNLFGFNTAALYTHFSNESEGVKMISALKPNILRFPGGTSANFYHFNRPGYGYKKADAELVAGSNAYKNAVNSAKKETEDLQRNGRSSNYAVDMVTLLKATGSSVLLVTNHLNSDDEENMAMIDFFYDSGVSIAGIELGNEYYLKAYKEEFPTVQTYLKAVKPLAKKIRSKYPDIPLAVVSAPNSAMKSLNAKRTLETDAWNTTLAAEDFYDGYVVHLYAKNKGCDQKAVLSQIAECYVKENLEYITQVIPRGIDAYQDIYGPRKMWLTEWNIKEVFDGMGNTLYQGLYMAEHYLMLVDQGEVAIATHHNLLTGGTGFNVISSGKGGNFQEMASYHVAELLSPLFQGDVRQQELNITKDGNNRFLSLKSFKKGNTTFIAAVNQSNTITALSLDNMANMAIERSTVYGESLLLDGINIKKEQIGSGDQRVLEIPAYSVSLITLESK